MILVVTLTHSPLSFTSFVTLYLPLNLILNLAQSEPLNRSSVHKKCIPTALNTDAILIALRNITLYRKSLNNLRLYYYYYYYYYYY